MGLRWTKDEMAMCGGDALGDPSPMKKRALAALLWFYSAWYAGAMVAHVLGLSDALGPIFGTAAAAIVAGDPRRLIWAHKNSAAGASMPGTQQPA
jgi:hypothetical protein